jgi:hydroxyethylthiazole kinase-like uncharacterized protein yjeF
MRKMIAPKVLRVEEMLAVERAADAGGLTYDQMMENAGIAIVEVILELWPEAVSWDVLILAGPGNNGGDGLVVGYHLKRAGAEVTVVLTKDRSSDDQNYTRLKASGARIMLVGDAGIEESLDTAIEKADLLIDAVLGTGFKLPVRGSAKRLLALARQAVEKSGRDLLTLAVDCPSGMDCDSGEVADETIPADMTVTLAAVKTGLLRFPGAEYAGELIVGGIGLDPGLPELERIKIEYAVPDTIARLLPERPADAHKGTFGRVLVIAGSINYPGAAALAGLGAYRVGAGLVTLVVPDVLQAFLVPVLPEATWTPLGTGSECFAPEHVHKVREALPGSASAIIGPGFGLAPSTNEFLRALFDELPEALSSAAWVIDADALRHLSELDNWWERLPSNCVLTPHPGEMAAMTGKSVAEIQDNRQEQAARWAEKWGQVLVLKGAFTVVASPGGSCTVMPFATSALASGGTGDVLAGAIGGFLGQGLSPYSAAVAGTYIHGLAGIIAAENLGSEAGVVAGDVCDAVPQAIEEVLA